MVCAKFLFDLNAFMFDIFQQKPVNDPCSKVLSLSTYE